MDHGTQEGTDLDRLLAGSGLPAHAAPALPSTSAAAQLGLAGLADTERRQHFQSGSGKRQGRGRARRSPGALLGERVVQPGAVCAAYGFAALAASSSCQVAAVGR